MKPLVPAQLPSVDTFPPAEGEGTADEALVEVLTVDEAALVDETALVDEALRADEELITPLPPQLPKEDWQPVPQ